SSIQVCTLFGEEVGQVICGKFGIRVPLELLFVILFSLLNLSLGFQYHGLSRVSAASLGMIFYEIIQSAEAIFGMPILHVLRKQIDIRVGMGRIFLQCFLVCAFSFLRLAGLRIRKTQQLIMKSIFFVIWNHVYSLNSAIRLFLANIKQRQIPKKRL